MVKADEKTIREVASRVRLNWLLRSTVRMLVKNKTGQLPSWSDNDMRRAVAMLRINGIMTGDTYDVLADPTEGD